MTIVPKSARTLRTRMASATKWVVAGSAATHALRFLANLLVTRLLAPEMFGLVAIATTVGVIIAMLSDLGLRQAVMRSPRGEDPIFLDTVWTIQVIRGGVLFIGSVSAAGILVGATHLGYLAPDSTYGSPLLPLLIGAAGFASVIIGSGSTLTLSASRQLDTKLIFLFDFVSTLIGLSVMLLTAWLTHSIWSLIVGTYASTICGVILSHIFKPGEKNHLRLERKAVAEIISFGKWLALSSAVTVFAVNGDRLLLAGMTNANNLGLYSIALSLVGAIKLVVGQLIEKVILPAFSEIARNEPTSIPYAYFKFRAYIDPGVLGISGLLFACGSELVKLLYDPRYEDAGAILSILSLSLIFERYWIAQQVYIAIGKPAYLVSLNFVRLAVTITGIPVGYLVGGFKGALVAIALRDLPVLPLVFWFNALHGLNNWQLELRWLLFWPAGYVLGVAIVAAK